MAASGSVNKVTTFPIYDVYFVVDTKLRLFLAPATVTHSTAAARSHRASLYSLMRD